MIFEDFFPKDGNKLSPLKYYIFLNSKFFYNFCRKLMKFLTNQKVGSLRQYLSTSPIQICQFVRFLKFFFYKILGM